jgi:hypothetical protein
LCIDSFFPKNLFVLKKQFLIYKFILHIQCRHSLSQLELGSQ